VGGLRYSPLTQIEPGNVADLELAWSHHSGDVLDGTTSLGKSSFQATPILLDETLYYCSPVGRVIAVDAETGRERWSHDPQVDVSNFYVINCRGVSSWVDSAAEPGAVCARRILSGTLDARLLALDADTGRPCSGFGEAGAVDLRAGIGDTQPGEYAVTSPPLVVGDLVVTGSMVLDNRRRDAPGGVVRAFDARSGALVWGWDPVPPQAETGHGTAGEDPRAWQRGTTNAWSILSADPERGLVFVPTGNTSPDYWGGHRGDLDHYSSSVVALDAATGRVVWRFQTVHHDVWDYDVPAQPTLYEHPGQNGPVPALVQATKTGFLYFLDRETGEPLFGVDELPAPQQGFVADETPSFTQPIPRKPPALHPAGLTPEQAFGFTPWDRGRCREALTGLRSDGLFTPPSLQGSVQFPGMIGGMNWGGVSVDPERGILVVNTQRIATLVRLVPRAEFVDRFGDDPPAFGFEPQAGTPYALQRMPLLSPLGAPCNPPPWGTLVGIDIASGDIRWEVPLGTTRDLAPFPLWLKLGVPNLGGPIATASGLVFIGATTDHYLRAFDIGTGEELFKTRLPTSAHSTPMTYRLRPNGRQYLVIAAGGHGILGTPPGDALLAFALPAS